MTLRHLRGVIFDVDGTLVDSNDLHVQAWSDAFERFGVQIERETIRSHIGKGGDLLVPDLLDAKQMRRFGDELREWRGEHFRKNHLEKVRPFAGAADAMRGLADSGLAIALASSSDPDEVEHHIESLGVRDLLDVVTSKGDVEMSKPVPDVFEAAVDKLRQGDAVIVVGDTPYDILAAHRIALPVIAVRSGGFPENTLERAEFLFDSVRDLPGALERIDEWFEDL